MYTFFTYETVDLIQFERSDASRFWSRDQFERSEHNNSTCLSNSTLFTSFLFSLLLYTRVEAYLKM